MSPTTIKITRTMSNEALWTVLWIERSGIRSGLDPATFVAAHDECNRRAYEKRGRFKRGRLSVRAEYAMARYFDRMNAYLGGCDAGYRAAESALCTLADSITDLQVEVDSAKLSWVMGHLAPGGNA